MRKTQFGKLLAHKKNVQTTKSAQFIFSVDISIKTKKKLMKIRHTPKLQKSEE